MQRVWGEAVAQLKTEPGIVVTESDMRDGKFIVAGLRDPLAVDPSQVLAQAGVDPARVISRWVPYQDLNLEFMLKRLQVSLDPPPAIRLSLEDGRIIARGSASSTWLEQARRTGQLLPAGGPALRSRFCFDRCRSASVSSATFLPEKAFSTPCHTWCQH